MRRQYIPWVLIVGQGDVSWLVHAVRDLPVMTVFGRLELRRPLASGSFGQQYFDLIV